LQNAPLRTHVLPVANLILVADQVLWLSDGLHCSLIIPHQIRSHGNGVCDDPWDPHRPLGINLESIFKPLVAAGPNLFFKSKVPTNWELSRLPIIEITSPTWNPADLRMSGPRSAPTRVVDCLSTARRDVLSRTTEPLTAISPVLDLHCIFSLLANAVLVHGALTGTRADACTISAAFTSERHSSVTFENLSRKWNIGLETAKRTLQVTTQRGIRTAVHPLHRRYHVDHLHLNR
jgi:hypothetical protein